VSRWIAVTALAIGIVGRLVYVGYHPNVIPWLKARDVAVLGGADLQAAADMAARLNRWEFLFVASPLRIPGISSSPFNPLAIF
jgi:hypothetical protein